MTVVNLDLGGEWQTGPDFLQQPADEWPIKSKSRVSEMPEVKRSFAGTVSLVSPCSIASRIKNERFSSFNRLLRTTARIEKLHTKYKRNTMQTQRNSQTTQLSQQMSVMRKPTDQACTRRNAVKHWQRQIQWIATNGRGRCYCSGWKGRKVDLFAHIDSGHLAVEAKIARIRTK